MAALDFFIFLVFFFFIESSIGVTSTANEENAVTGEPFVNCAADAIYVKFKTNATFVGQVNVKFAPNRFCYQVLVTNNQIELLVPHEECSVSRRRSFSPPGILLEASVSVSFHPEFTTAADRLFHFQCFHKKNKKGLEIGSATLPPIENGPAPTCSYGIFESRGGRLAGTVALGQRVFHEWKCEGVQDSCLIVRNCALVAGDQRHEVVDSEGCSKAVALLPELHYENQSYVAQNVSVFGVASKPLVYFECELLLLPSTSESCGQPKCDKRERRSIEAEENALEVRSQRIEISELERSARPEPPQPATGCPESVSEAKDGFFISSTLAVLLSIVFVTGSLLTGALLSLLLLRRYKHYNIASTPRS